MAGLVPAIPVLLQCRMKGGWVYFMTNRRNGVSYVGVTNDLLRRAFEHRESLIDGFSKKYALKRPRRLRAI
jgi:putative endonuclease